MDIDTQKIDRHQLEILDMVIASFIVDDKDGKSCFFEKTFLLVDISMNIIFGMPFLNLSNVKIDFNDREFK